MEYEGGCKGVGTVSKPRFDYRNPKTVNDELKRLSWWKKLLLRWRGQVSVGKRQPERFRGPMEFFLFPCEKCGPILTYPRGFEGTIDCMNCRMEDIRDWRKKKTVNGDIGSNCG